MNGAVGPNYLLAIDAWQAVQGSEGEGQGGGIALGRGKLAAEVGGARARLDPGEATKAA